MYEAGAAPVYLAMAGQAPKSGYELLLKITLKTIIYILQGVPKKVVPRFFYTFSLITLVVLGYQKRYLCLWKGEISVLILSIIGFHSSVWGPRYSG